MKMAISYNQSVRYSVDFSQVQHNNSKAVSELDRLSCLIILTSHQPQQIYNLSISPSQIPFMSRP